MTNVESSGSTWTGLVRSNIPLGVVISIQAAPSDSGIHFASKLAEDKAGTSMFTISMSRLSSPSSTTSTLTLVIPST